MRDLIWGGCHWSDDGRRYEDREYYFEDGVLRYDVKRCVPGKAYEVDYSENGKTLKWIESLGYKTHMIDAHIDRMVMTPCVGKTREEMEARIKWLYERLRERREREQERRDAWGDLRDRFGGFVIGLEKEIDVYETGFSVRVLFSSGKSFADRRKFLKENRMDFLRYAMEEVSKSKRMTAKIGDIKFYSPVEIVNLRSAEAEIKFEVKGIA